MSEKNVLADIVKQRRIDVKSMKRLSFKRSREVVSTVDSLRKNPIIAEIKMASPAYGKIKAVSPIEQARLYERGGAGAISVLTEEHYFKGSFNYLHEVASKIKLPVLCKDFIVDELQIENAHMTGADFILLIVSVLSESELDHLIKVARSFKLDILFELFFASEFSRIKKYNPTIVGINSRDLKTLIINKESAGNELAKLQGDFLKVAESGIEQSSDIAYFKTKGANTFLIGSSLMKNDNPVELLQNFNLEARK